MAHEPGKALIGCDGPASRKRIHHGPAQQGKICGLHRRRYGRSATMLRTIVCFRKRPAHVDHDSWPLSLGSSDPAVWSNNLRKLNSSAVAIFEKGHIPIIGVNMALPIIDAAGQEFYETIMLPLSLCLTERCDAILRIEGKSIGADAEVDRFRARGLRVFQSLDEIPNLRSQTG
jgi:hypothetical protein